jgi:hypothetical protein
MIRFTDRGEICVFLTLPHRSIARKTSPFSMPASFSHNVSASTGLPMRMTDSPSSALAVFVRPDFVA